MTIKDYMNENLQVFTITDEQRRLHEIAMTYHDDCEKFDFAICSGINPKTKEPTPTSTWELVQINANARRVKERLCEENPSFTRQQISKAISRLNK